MFKIIANKADLQELATARDEAVRTIEALRGKLQPIADQLGIDLILSLKGSRVSDLSVGQCLSFASIVLENASEE